MLKRKKKPVDKEVINKRNEFFLQIWNTRPHYCVNCKKWLGNEPLSYMFDHLIEKSKRKDLEFIEENIALVCFDCHGNKTNGFPGEKHLNLINNIKTKYEK